MEKIKTNETCKMLIKFFNLQAGTSMSATGKMNLLLTECCLAKAGDDVALVKNHIKEWVDKNPNIAGMMNAYEECMNSFEAPRKPVVETSVHEDEVKDSMGVLEKAMVQIIANLNASTVEQAVVQKAEDSVKDFIRREYGTLERKIVTVIDGQTKQLDGVQHEKFETVLKYVANKEPVFLTGPAGSGKNELCKQVAKALDLPFYFTNAVTQEYKLTGFTDAMGNYQPTQFYQAFTEGGLFMLDEMDASIPEVLVILNAAIANGYFDFPAPIGFKEAHPNFRVIAAGNTLGHGADFEYVGRNQLDGASLDRFAVIQINYSPVIEEAMACGNDELLKFCREYRKAAVDNGLNIIVSYRAIKRLAKMVQLLGVSEALETGLVRGLEHDDIIMIANKISASQYRTALMELASKMD